jgi:hypothetical protein
MSFFANHGWRGDKSMPGIAIIIIGFVAGLFTILVIQLYRRVLKTMSKEF